MSDKPNYEQMAIEYVAETTGVHPIRLSTIISTALGSKTSYGIAVRECARRLEAEDRIAGARRAALEDASDRVSDAIHDGICSMDECARVKAAAMEAIEALIDKEEPKP